MSTSEDETNSTISTISSNSSNTNEHNKQFDSNSSNSKQQTVSEKQSETSFVVRRKINRKNRIPINEEYRHGYFKHDNFLSKKTANKKMPTGSWLADADGKKEEKIGKIMNKSVINGDFIKRLIVPPMQESEREMKRQRRKEREKVKGNWFDLPATEMSDDVRMDLELLKQRSIWDLKRFYRKDNSQLDSRRLPKYFQVGRIQEDPTEFYSARIPKKERKRTLADELLADEQFRRVTKKKFKQVMEEKEKGLGVYRLDPKLDPKEIRRLRKESKKRSQRIRNVRVKNVGGKGKTGNK